MAATFEATTHVRRRGMATAAMVAVAVATAAAVVAAVPPPPPTGWAQAVAAIPAHLSAVTRPLSPSVSVFTDGTYGPVPTAPPAAGCPTAFAIDGELGAANNEFRVPAPRVSISGTACSGDVALAGVFGPPLAELLATINATALVEGDPKAAVAVGDGGPLTCGGTTWAGENQAFVFAVAESVPVLVYLDSAAPARQCVLAVAGGTPPPAATPTATPVPT